MLEPLNEGGQVSAAAAAVVQAVVETGRQHFKEQLPSLPPLPPSISALQHSNTVLAEERGTMTAEEHIEGSLESLRHDSLAVRSNALQVGRTCCRLDRGLGLFVLSCCCRCRIAMPAWN